MQGTCCIGPGCVDTVASTCCEQIQTLLLCPVVDELFAWLAGRKTEMDELVAAQSEEGGNVSRIHWRKEDAKHGCDRRCSGRFGERLRMMTGGDCGVVRRRPRRGRDCYTLGADGSDTDESRNGQSNNDKAMRGGKAISVGTISTADEGW